MSIDHQSVSAHDSARDSVLRLGQRLRRARLARNLTQGEVAKNQFSISYISAVERGQIRPSLGALEKLAERLQVPMTDLLSEDELGVRSTAVSAGYRDSASERHRVETENTLREAQILLAQRKSDEAVNLLLRLQSESLSPRESAELRLTLATCYNEQGRAEEARRVAQEALTLTERAGERELAERLRSALGQALSQLHDHASALEQYRAAEQAIQEHETLDPTLQLSLLLAVGNQYWSLAEHEQGIASFLQAAEVAKEVLSPERLGSLYWTISRALAARGDHAGAESYAARSLGAYEEAEHRRAVTAVYTRLGVALAYTGQAAEALTQLRRAEALATGHQDLQGRAEAQRNLALVYLEEKRPHDAEQAARDALETAEQLADAAVQVSALVVLARVQEVRKQQREATQSYERAVELLQNVPERSAAEQLPEVYAQFSEFLERHGESQRAFEMLKQAYKSTQ